MRPTRTACRLSILFVLTALVPHDGRADQALTAYSNTVWTAKDGLPSPSISAVVQDRQGYLWLGSLAGLVRFDGVHFALWNTFGSQPLPETSVRSLLLSRDGSLWVGFGSPGGAARIRGRDVEVYHTEDGLPVSPIRSIVEDAEGTIWVGGFSGLARFRNGRWEHLGTEFGLPDATTVDSLFEDRNGDLYAATSAGVLRLNRAKDVLEPTESGSFRAMDVDQNLDGSIWLTGQRHPFRRIQSQSNAESVYGAKLLRDRQGHLWVATLGQGLLHVPSTQWENSPTVERFTQQQGLTSDWISCIYEDREGGIWVGTETGLNRLARSAANPAIERSEFHGRGVRAVIVDAANNLWTGTIDGLFRTRNGSSRRFDERDGLPSASIRSLHVDQKNTLWAATVLGPARLVGDRFVALVLPHGVRLDRIEAMATDGEGGLWICDFAGIYRWKDGVLKEIQLEDAQLKRSPASTAFTDSHGDVWIGFSGGGLIRHHAGQIEYYKESDGLAEDAVRFVFEDHEGALWIGRRSGLSKFVDNRFASINHSHGFPGNLLTAAIQQDDEGYLWIGTDLGLVRLKPSEAEKAIRDPQYRIQYRVIDASDGLEGVPSAPGAPISARNADGTFWFITSAGMAQVDPRVAKTSLTAAPPVIEALLADQRPFELPEPRLPARTSRVQIDFTAPTFAGASRTMFRYRLDGYDTAWVAAGTRRQAFYTNLPPRSYQFRVASSLGEGQWVELAAPLQFSIAPAFYQTTWFYLLCAVAPVVAVWSAWRFRLRQVRKHFTLVLTERERLAREIHDTLLQGMLGVALQLHGIAETLDSPRATTRERCERARDRLEHYIRETRQSIWDLRSTRNDLVASMRETVEAAATDADARVSLEITGKPRRFEPLREKHVLRIGREAISNAVRHARASEVRVSLGYEDNSVRLQVSDDGCGFDPTGATAIASAHWGLKSMEERANQAGGQFTLTSNPGHGTAVELVVPLA